MTHILGWNKVFTLLLIEAPTETYFIYQTSHPPYLNYHQGLAGSYHMRQVRQMFAGPLYTYHKNVKISTKQKWIQEAIK